MMNIGNRSGSFSTSDAWPELPLRAWQPTYHNLHMWTQIAGKVRLALTETSNHWWNVPFYVNARGLTSSPVPYGAFAFEMLFDFCEHKFIIDRSDGGRAEMELGPRTVAEFYEEFFVLLRGLGIECRINPRPVEVVDPIPFTEDRLYRAYDRDAADRLRRILVSCDALFHRFRSRFVGKNSPVQFFWGSFDLAVTRFSGRRAPERPGADAITREAYSHEVISAGWWPGGAGIDAPAFYCYVAPEPAGFRSRKVQPATAFYDEKLGEFLLMYDDVRSADSPAQLVLEFLQSTYESAAALAGWNRAELERGQAA
jgi:hypothetical protein